MANPIERKCCDYADLHGFLSHKMGVSVSIGWPDRMFIGYNAVIVFVEFKRPGEPLSPAQIRKIKKFSDRGITVFVVEDYEIFKNIIDLARQA